MSRLALFALVLLASSPLAAQTKEIINPPGAPNTLPFSSGIKVGNQIWLAGIEGEISGDIEKETRSAFDQIKSLLQQGGFTMNDIVAVQVYMADLAEFPKMNAVYRAMMPDPKPTRTTVQVAKLVGDARIEITVTAVKTKA